MHSSVDRHRDRTPSRTPAVVLAATLAAVTSFIPITAAPRQRPSNTAPDTKERTRLLDLQHASVSQPQEAVREGTLTEQLALAPDLSFEAERRDRSRLNVHRQAARGCHHRPARDIQEQVSFQVT